MKRLITATLLTTLTLAACTQQTKPTATTLPSHPTPSAAASHWPSKVFAPYMYIGSGDNFKLTDADDACGLKFYTLAFIIAKQERGPAATLPATAPATSPATATAPTTRPRRNRVDNTIYHKEPSWDGNTLMEKNLYKDQIDAIRARGGNVIMSFGGAAGKEMANIIDDPAELEAAYQKVIDTYEFTWLDFDVEGSNLEKGKIASEHRNTALANLQKKNPGLIISYTLPVDPEGISPQSQDLLKDAVSKGVKIHSANLMVMYFGNKFINKGKSEGQLGVDSANTAYAEIQKIDPSIQIGLCPCLGRNGSAAEIFTPDDAKVIKDFADQTPWVCSLHYWSINGDSGRRRNRNNNNATQPASQPTTQPAPNAAWTFAKIFIPFTTTD